MSKNAIDRVRVILDNCITRMCENPSSCLPITTSIQSNSDSHVRTSFSTAVTSSFSPRSPLPQTRVSQLLDTPNYFFISTNVANHFPLL